MTEYAETRPDLESMDQEERARYEMLEAMYLKKFLTMTVEERWEWFKETARMAEDFYDYWWDLHTEVHFVDRFLFEHKEEHDA